jgi:hypothetical protein
VPSFTHALCIYSPLSRSVAVNIYENPIHLCPPVPCGLDTNTCVSRQTEMKCTVFASHFASTSVLIERLIVGDDIHKFDTLKQGLFRAAAVRCYDVVIMYEVLKRARVNGYPISKIHEEYAAKYSAFSLVSNFDGSCMSSKFVSLNDFGNDFFFWLSCHVSSCAM